MLVSQARAEEQLSAPALACAAAVAAQSFLSEYLDVVEAPDNGHVQAAAAQCTADLAAGRQPTPEIVAAVAAYQPLHQLENGERLNRFDWPEPIARLIELQLNEPAREANLRASLPTLTPITDETSCAVQAQYESHPYPRWRKLDVPTVPLSLDRYLRENVGTGPVHALPAQTGARVLVAGCGTGRHAIRTAFRFTGCEVLAIDLSRSSLGYARRQSEALGLANVSYAQADLLELEQMDETFDVIESVGVLHHLADPTAGLGQLVKRLRPGGLLKLGLYSRAGRADINWARAWTEQNAIQGDARGIQRLRAWVRERAEAGDPHARSLLRRSDFFATSLVRDMLLHVCEHQFDFMQIQRMLAECDLAFLGLEPANMASYRRFRTRYPEPDKLTDLAAWAAFEREHPEMFRGMYQFWCQKPG
nr:class I SAM-dependent methyltransferase [Rhodovibrio salinarum]